MKTRTKNFTFHGGFNIGPYRYDVANLPTSGSYIEVIRSEEIKYPTIMMSFDLYSYGVAQGLGHFIKRLLWDILAESDKYKETGKLDISSAYAIDVDDDIRHVNFKFNTMQYMPDKEYKRDTILKEMMGRKKMTFKDVSEWCLSRIKRCKEYKITEEILEEKKKEFKDYNKIERDTVNIIHPLISKVANTKLDLSNCATDVNIDNLTVDDVNDILHNVFSINNFNFIQFQSPSSVTLYEIDELVSSIIEDVLNNSLKSSHYAKWITRHLPVYEEMIKVRELAEKPIYLAGEAEKITIDDTLKITECSSKCCGEENPSKHILVRTCPDIIDGAHLNDTDNFRGMYAYLGSIIAMIVFNNYIFAKHKDDVKRIHANDMESVDVVRVSAESVAIIRNKLLTINNNTNIENILSGFKEYAKDSYESSADFFINTLKEELLLLFTGGVSYRKSSFFTNNELMMLWNYNRVMNAEERAEDIDLVFGNREEYLFSPFVNALLSEHSVKIIKRFVILAINNLEFIEINNNI